jgi:pyridine nucleotide-disulfide oxidoreductase
VHICGEGATELIHIGQAVLNLKGTLEYFVENTFNYPTLAEAYKGCLEPDAGSGLTLDQAHGFIEGFEGFG